MDRIRVLRKDPGKPWREDVMDNTLDAFQKAVGGYIETVTQGDKVIVCNEEGIPLGLERNCSIQGVHFWGPVIVCGRKKDEFADVPIDIRHIQALSFDYMTPERSLSRETR